MKRSEQIGKIMPALLKAQKKIGAAKKGADNPFFKSKYADLGSVMEACKEPLNDEGISIIQSPTLVKNELTGESESIVETLLIHESGAFVSSEMKLILDKQDMQKLGSAISYAKRYTLQALAFIPSADDDANKASGKKTSKPNLKQASSFSKKESSGF